MVLGWKDRDRGLEVVFDLDLVGLWNRVRCMVWVMDGIGE